MWNHRRYPRRSKLQHKQYTSYTWCNHTKLSLRALLYSWQYHKPEDTTLDLSGAKITLTDSQGRVEMWSMVGEECFRLIFQTVSKI
jgi:hypothetical protein